MAHVAGEKSNFPKLVDETLAMFSELSYQNPGKLAVGDELALHVVSGHGRRYNSDTEGGKQKLLAAIGGLLKMYGTESDFEEFKKKAKQAEKKNNAARLIQKIFRGHLVRRKAKRRRRHVSFKGGPPDWRSDLQMGLCEEKTFKKDDPPSTLSSSSDDDVPEESDVELPKPSANAWIPRPLRNQREALAAEKQQNRSYNPAMPKFCWFCGHDMRQQSARKFCANCGKKKQ